MSRRSFSSPTARQSSGAREWLRRRARRDRNDAGDTLVEILISLTVLGVASVAILLAFATSISGSGVHRQAVSFDAALRNASAEATGAIAQLGITDFNNCTAANTVNTPATFTNLPTGYTAKISGVEYWTGSTWTGLQQPLPTTTCPIGVSTLQATSGLQLLTIQVTSKGQTATTTAVASNPTAPTNLTSCTGTKHLQWVSQPANGQAGQALTPVPVVAIEDSLGNPCATDASTIKLSIQPGTGASGAGLSNCSPSLGLGSTTFVNCSINTPGTGYQLTATDATDGLTISPLSVAFNISAGIAVQLSFATSPSNGTGGLAFPTQPVVYIKDSAGNLVSGDSSVVTLAIGSNPGSGTLSGCTTSTTNGVATFAGCNIDKVGTGYTLTATDSADNLTTASTPSNTFNITAGPAAQLVFSNSPTVTAAGDAFPSSGQPVVAFQDAGGNLTSNGAGTVTLGIGTNPSGGTLSGCSQSRTGGVVTFSGCGINKVGNGYTLMATSGSLTPGTSAPFNVSTPALTSFTVSPATTTPTAGTAFNVTVTGLDQSGVAFQGLTGAQAVGFSGPSNAPNGTAPTYPATVSFTKGAGTASVTLFDAQTTQLTATLQAVTGTSSSITVGSKSTTTGFTVVNPGTQAAGAQFNLTIDAVDQYGNTTTSFTGTKTLTFSGPSNAPNGTSPTYPTARFGGPNVSFSSGVATAAVTLVDAQTTTITVSQSSPSLTGTSTSFTVTDGGAANFSLSNPGSQTAGTAFSVSINATDSDGNVASSFSGPQTVIFTGPSNSPNGTAPLYPLAVTFTSGAAHASVTLYDAQSTTLTATEGGTNGTSPSFTVSGTGTVGSFVVANPGPQTAGSSFGVGITAGDPYGNKVTTYAGSKALTFSGPSNSPSGQVPTYPSSVTFTAGTGTATMTLFDAQSTTLTVSQGAVTGTSPTFTVSGASTASKFTVANPGTQTAGAAFNESITADDQWGNAATGYTGFKTITFTGPASSPSGRAPSYPTFVTFSGGSGTAAITLYNASTSTNLTATQGTVAGSSGIFTVTAGGTNSFSLSNPGAQTAGTSFSVTITAIDSWGNTTTSYTGSQTLSFSGPANSPTGQAPAYPSSVSFSSGVGTATITLYDAQTASITATQVLLTGSTGNFTVSGLGTVTRFNLSSPSPTAGTAFNETITAADQYGNTVTSYTGSKAMSFSGPSNSPSGQAPTYPANVTFAAGVGTASITLFNAQTVTLTVTATVGSFQGSTSVTVAPAAASKFTVSNPGTQVAGTAFPVTLTAFDQYGNQATGYTGAKAITFSGPSNSPSGQAPTYPSTVSFSGGVGTPSITLYDVQSTTLTATQGSVTGTSTAFSITPTGASSFSVSNPGTVTAGSAFNVTLTALDAFGNAAPSYTGTKTVTFSGASSAPGGQAPIYPSTVAFSSGSGTASSTLFNAQSVSLAATQGLITGTTTFTVAGASATAFSVPTPGTQAAGTAFNVTITAIDSYGNPATGYTGTKTVTFSGPSNSPSGQAPTYPASVSFNSSGAGTASVTLFDAQSTTLKATQSLLIGQSGTFTVTGASTASRFTVSNPGTVTANVPFSVSIAAFDQWGNAATAYTGAKSLTFSGPSNSPSGQAPTYPSTVTFNSSGVGTASITLFDAQSTTLTASLGGATGTSTAFTVNPGSTTDFNVSNPTTQTAGTAFNLTITAIDSWGNTTPSYTGTRTVTFSGPSNSPSGQAPTYPSTVTFNSSGVGTASVTLFDAQTTSITAAQGLLIDSTNTFTVNPVTTTDFSVSNPSTQTAGTAFNLTITAIDTWGNATPSYTGTKTITFTGPSSSPSGQAPTYPASVSFNSSGVGTASIRLFDAQTTSITATQGSLSDATNTFTVSPASASTFRIPTPATQTAGTAFAVALTALDQWGNTATSYTGSHVVAFSDPDNAPDGTAPTTSATIVFSSGQGTASSIILVDAESTTLTATQGSITGTSGTFTVNPGAQASLYLANISQQPSPAISCTGPSGSLTTCTSTGENNDTSTPSARTVTAGLQLVDTFGNAVTASSTVTVTVTSTGSSSGSNIPSTITIASGHSASTTTFTLVRASGNRQTASVTAKVGGTTELTVTLSS
jgi:hypothetical protein